MDRWERRHLTTPKIGRVRLLKAAGFNAVRTSHNPPSEAFLDACDRHGLLVIDEAFDGWARSKVSSDYGPQFEHLWEHELQAMVERDRRHPSVVMWSIGNEVYERGDESGQRLARQLADFVRDLDPSRPVTIGLNGLGNDPWQRLDSIFEPVDVCGYNYETSRFEADHKRVPNRVMYSSESYPRDVVENWQAVRQHPYVIGDFVWSAIDYLGEAGIGRVFPLPISSRDGTGKESTFPGEPPHVATSTSWATVSLYHTIGISCGTEVRNCTWQSKR